MVTPSVSATRPCSATSSSRRRRRLTDLDGDERITRAERYTGEGEAALGGRGPVSGDLLRGAVPPAPAATIPTSPAADGSTPEKPPPSPPIGRGSAATRPAGAPRLLRFPPRRRRDDLDPRELPRLARPRLRPVEADHATAGSALVFGRISDGLAIDVERIAEKAAERQHPDLRARRQRLHQGRGWPSSPPPSTTPRAGYLPTTTAGLLAAKAARRHGEPRRHSSRWPADQRMNGSKTVTREQFLGLFDNSLFWTAVSLADDAGKRRL